MNKRQTIEFMNLARAAKARWTEATSNFNRDFNLTLRRLIVEGVSHRMSVQQIAKETGRTPKQIRTIMHQYGLRSSDNKTVLVHNAATALATNAKLMGIEPRDMDLTSPLAYLPMGDKLKQELTDARVHRVTELDDSL